MWLIFYSEMHGTAHGPALDSRDFIVFAALKFPIILQFEWAELVP